ncbi:DgyrCDS8694 [Dimorphilus gyrociliatus]|nr:DgyrCDS8694 [Dimorphilus gyrociliatus]
MVLIMLSIFLSTVVINISRRGDAMEPVPTWLKTVSIKGLARIFCSKIEARTKSITSNSFTSPLRKKAKNCKKSNERMRAFRITHIEEDHDEIELEDFPKSPTNKIQMLHCLDSHFLMVKKHLREIEGAVDALNCTMKEKQTSKEIRQLKLEWQIVAMTLDRFFFIFFFIAIVSSLITLFPRPF